MPSTTIFGWAMPIVGGSNNAWGAAANDMFEQMDTDVGAINDTADAALPKAGGAMTGDIDMAGNEIQNAVVTDLSVPGFDIGAPVDVTVTGSISTFAATLDLSLGSAFLLDGFTPSANAILTLTFTNRPVSVSKVVFVAINPTGSLGVSVEIVAGGLAWALPIGDVSSIGAGTSPAAIAVMILGS